MPLLTQADPLIPLPAVQRGIFNQPGTLLPMRLKAIGLTQHGGPPGWLEESDPPGYECVPMTPALKDHIHRLNMEVDLRSLFGLHVT
jgi:hypothetical protein